MDSLLQYLLVNSRDLFFRGYIRQKANETGMTPKLSQLYTSLAYRLLGDERYTAEVGGTGTTFEIDTIEEARHFYPTFSEEDDLVDVVRAVRDDDTFYDIGAHIGIYACVIAQTLTNGEVLAFEPHPENADKIRKNLDRNTIRNAEVYEYALSDREQTSRLDIGESESGTVGRLTTSDDRAGIPIEVVRGDEVVERHGLPTPTVLKIDVEGAEYRVLRGFGDLLDECRLVYCEVHPSLTHRYGSTPQDVHRLLEERDFVVDTAEAFGDRYHIRATR